MKKNNLNKNYFKFKNDFKFNNNIIEASKKAQEVIKSGKENVFNATIGSLFDENNQFFIFKSVFNIYNNKIQDSTKASYCSSIDGGKEFIDITKKWLFKDHYFLYDNSYVCATPGGSAALSSILKKVNESKSCILIPNYTWEPVELMSIDANIEIVKFKMFDDNNLFYLDDLFSQIDKIKNQYKRIILYINDPVHNPTSFSMNINHWNTLINKINQMVENEFVILNDVAYIEFAHDQTNQYLSTIKNINDNILFLFCISYSKSLTFYGQRLGAVVIYHNQNEISKSFYDLLNIHAKANWSNSNHGAIKTLVELDRNKEEYLKEKNMIIETLKKRFQVFLTEANNVDLKLLETKIGFFITIPLENLLIDKYVKKLNDNNVFVVPINNGIRIGICSLNINQCQKLPKLLKQYLDEVK